MHTRRVKLLLVGAWLALGLKIPGAAQESFETARPAIWQNGVGNGFEPGTRSFAVEAGANYGLAAFGSREAHHLALVDLSYGKVFGKVMGQEHWYRGNLEWRVQLFGGAEFSPDEEWLIGLTPHLRYNFATGTRWVPFFDLGAGVTATGIGPPDLSNTFEFNLQGGGGVQWFFAENLAATVEVRYLHMSCGGISHPNYGLNGVTGLIGVTTFF